MKRMRLALVACMAVYVVMCTGIGQAYVAAGACVLGNGVTLTSQVEGDTFVGVNVGQNSETAAYDNQADYEEQCCAETNQPPDCFNPVNVQN